MEQMVWQRVLEPIQVAMQCGQYAEAMHRIQLAFRSFHSPPLAVRGQLFLCSAECHFNLGQLQQCLDGLIQGHQLVTPIPSERKKSFDRWIQRSEKLLDTHYGEEFSKFCLQFLSKTGREKAQCLMLLGSNSDSQTQFLQAFQIDRTVYEEYQSRWKQDGILAMKRKDYSVAKQLLQRALRSSIDQSQRETRRSILSHLTTIHFYLKEYDDAFAAGQQLLRETGPNVDEATRWKERGKKLFQDKNFTLLVNFYSLAIEFTPRGTNQDELRSVLLSNRSFAFCKLGRFKEAFEDALVCVQINASWSKGHYRLGSSLVGLKRFHEGCGAFCKAFHFADASEKIDVLLQIINVAIQLPSGLEDIPLTVPKPLVQNLINRFVEKRDWEKLSFLFLGGGGATVYKYGYGNGGLASNCDASCVPLELIVNSTIKKVNVAKFVEALIKNGASPKGSPGCKESPLNIATKKNDKQLIDVLSKFDRSHTIKCFEKGTTAYLQKKYRESINMLSIAVKGELTTEQFIGACRLLSDSYYEVKEYQSCIKFGWKAFSKDPLQHEDYANKWKNRGNELLKSKLYDVMSDCYTLALNSAPSSCTEMRAAIYSNRSMAYVNQKKMNEAKEDAKQCIDLRKTWFRGYSRLAACWTAENRYQEAIDQYCRGIRAVKTNDEKNLMTDILSTCMKPYDGIIVLPIEIPTKVMNGFVKQAVKDNDANKIRSLFLEKRYHLPGLSELQCLGSFADCVASIPLQMIMASNLPDKDQLIEELLSRGALPNGELVDQAMEARNYKLLVKLFRYGANPQTILEYKREPFDPKAPHLSQWLSLGRKVIKNNPTRAEMFYSIALEYPEAAKDKSAQHEAFKALSDICFEKSKYNECIEKGRECFKVSPVKSEVEALKWQRRAKVLTDKGMHNIVPTYLTHAMNYAPPSNAKLRYELLCMRSVSYRLLSDYQQAIEDGKSATSIRPSDMEGYECLLTCYKKLQLHSKTFSVLVNCLKVEQIHSYKRHQYLKDALDIAVSLPEGTSNLISEVAPSSLQQISDEAVKSGNWDLVRLLYLGGGGPKKYEIRKGGLATGCIRAESVPIEDVVSAHLSFKPETLDALLDHGADVNGLRGNANPLVTSASKKDEEVMKVLLKHGANPCVKQDGNMPLVHKEANKAIDSGDLKVLQVLVSSLHPDLENVQDSNGNTLFHHVMTGKKTIEKCKVLSCLTNAKLNPDMPNKQGKRPTEMCNKKDDRNKMLKKFLKEYIPKPVEQSKQQNLKQQANVQEKPSSSTKHTWEDAAEREVESKRSNEDDMQVEETKKPIPNSKFDIAKQKKEQDIKYILYLIDRLDVEKINASAQEEQVEENLEQAEAENEQQEDDSDEDQDEEEDKNTIAIEEVSHDDLVSSFENLTWEVDCTENVWKTMKSTKVSEKTRNQIIRKICMLAEGRWSTKQLCKRLEGEPKEKGIHLYETRITKGARIIWEKTIAFSARCSKDPNVRLSAETHGLIYSDIIRVWDIVLNHKDLEHRIQNVVKSHQRGSHCIIKADLKGMKRQTSESSNQLTLPSYYQERKASSDELSNVFFPPASSEDNEYHILKFYSVTSALINTLLDSDQKNKIDFPFKVTELEHEIINLKQKKPRAIILLGRSGTGKTTCCLYRLWTEFQTYWENAINAGPHMPMFVPIKSVDDSDDDGELATEEAENVPCCASSLHIQRRPTTEEAICQDQPSTPKYFEVDESSCDVQETVENEENKPGGYEHLHQMFITKNTVLCSEVQKNFKQLKNACPATKDFKTPDDSLPNHISDIDEEAWPLFTGARDWLLLLDASLPGEPFFRRTKDGSLLGKIEGWGQEDTYLHFIPDDDDEEDEVEEKVEHERPVPEKAERQNPKLKKVPNNKREITYQVFLSELWPRMKTEVKNDFHPTLVWTEIRSFIKGSAEALKTSNGYLSCEEYEVLGRKRAPAFLGDRPTVYKLFEIYKNISRQMFDEADLVYNLYKRLVSDRDREWSIHYVYVDETQDFTQAELYLLILCCRFPDRMFFTGDTAQSIMRGIAFRFQDLKSLFHSIKTCTMTAPKDSVRVPDRLYQLTHNYRSHAGILSLASSIVNLLQDFFPESFDRLDKDCGLFEGPKPVLLESCSLADLAMILRGNKRHGSRIEFGAHQAVLVVSEDARQNMPEELKHGLVLTIYEAKGLEFDDVLIYNFFKDSHARKEWRVVTSYKEKSTSEARSDVTGLVTIPEEDLNFKSRPLDFNYEKHKVLNSELKFLYTAITRARVNVWFFDEDEENRQPVFEYFQRLNLVRAITLDEQAEGSTTALTSMFAEGSTPSEWKDQGQFFYNKRLWDVAEKCFALGEDEMMVRRCNAQKQAQDALQNPGNPKLMKELFRTAAKQFLECDMPSEAEVCLYNAREKILLANLYKKMGKFVEASKLFRAEKCYDEASQCMEEMNNYDQAIEIFCKAKLYEQAIQVLERYKSLNVERPLENQGIIPPKPNRTIQRLCRNLAETYFSDDKRKEMEDALQRLLPANRILFLKNHNCVEEAARALVEDEKKEEAARHLLLHGRFKEAMKYSENPKFLADCNLYEARSLVKSKSVENLETVELLNVAITYYRRCKDKSGEGEAMLLLGRQQNNIDDIKESGKIFDSDYDVCGEIEVVEDILSRDIEQFYFRIIVRAIERVLELIVNLHKPYTQLQADKQRMISKCEQFFGLSTTPDLNIRKYCTRTNERFHTIFHQDLQSCPGNTSVEETIDVKQAYGVIACHLEGKAVTLVHKMTRLFKTKLEQLKQPDQPSPSVIATLIERFEIIFNWTYLDGVTYRHQNVLKRLVDKIPQQTVEHLTTDDNKKFTSCKHLITFLFPAAGPSHSKFLSEQLDRIRNHKAVKGILISYGDYLCKELHENKLSIDTFLDISRVRQVVEQNKLTMQYLQRYESSFKTRYSKEHQNMKLRLQYEHGMVTSNYTTFQSFLRFWETGKSKLVNGDVIQSLHETCRRFLGYSAKSRTLAYPSIANTVMILENQLTVALVMFARLNSQRQMVFSYLPESYLHRLGFADDLNCTSQRHKWSFLAVEHSACSLSRPQDVYNCNKNVISLLVVIVKMMFGNFTTYFNVFLDTFCTKDTQQLVVSGVAERVMVLALTMLVNCGMAISVDCQSIILGDVFSVAPPASLPDYMKAAFASLNDARSFADVVAILKALLNAGNEKLFQVKWKGSVNVLDTRVAEPNNNSLMFPVSVAEIKEGISQVYSVDTGRQIPSDLEKEEELRGQDDLEIEEQIDATGNNKDIEKQEREEENEEEKEAAIRIIIKFLRRCIQHKKALENKEEVRPSVDRLSSEFKVDSSACTICGVTFTKADEGMSSSFEDHITLDSHKKSEEEFKEYTEFYNGCRVEQVLNQAKSLHGQLQVENLDMELDMEILDEMRQKAWNIVQEIEKDRKWNNLKGLKSLMEKLEKKIQETQKLTEKVQADGKLVDDDDDDDFHEDDDELETKPMPVTEKQRKGKGHRSRRKPKPRK